MKDFMKLSKCEYEYYSVQLFQTWSSELPALMKALNFSFPGVYNIIYFILSLCKVIIKTSINLVFGFINHSAMYIYIY